MPAPVAAVVLTAALMGPAPQVSSPPAELPTLDLTVLPAEAAAAVGAAYAEAQRRPRDPAAVGRLAIVLHAWEQWEDAAAAYRAVQALAPRDSRWWHLGGLLETRRGRHAEALPLFGRAAALEPENLPVRLRIAEAKLETGDLDGAEPLFQNLVQHAQTAAAAEYGLGRIAMTRGSHERALEHFDRAVAAFPDFGAAHYGRALAYRRLSRDGDAGAALERQKRCLPCWPSTGDPVADAVAAVREDAGALLTRGIAHARQGEDRLAIEAHERAVALDPKMGQARVNLITLYGRAGNPAGAEAEYRQVLKLGTNLPEAHVNYAQVLLAHGRAADAVPVFRRALELTPADAQAWNGLGLALEQSGDTSDASDAYRQAVVHAPAFRAARFNYARTLVGAARLEEAIAELEKLRTPEDAETPRYLFALAAALVRAGHVERGRAEAQDALTLARRYGQTELAASIERDLALLR